MGPHRGPHLRHFNKRQGLGVLSGLVPNPPQSSAATSAKVSSATSQSAANSGDGGGIPGGLTSVLGDLTSVFMPTSGPSSTTTSNTPLTLSSSSSTGSTTTPTPSVHSTSSSSTSTTLTTPTSTPTSTSTSSSPATDTVYTSSTGTNVVYITSNLPAVSPTTTPRSFLQDPSLEGGVFALVGIIVLIIIFIAVTWTVRKRRRARLERDLAAAVTFDPGATDYYERQQDSTEKPHRRSASSSGHGHGRGIQPAYVPQQEYHDPNYPVGYTQYPVAAYRAPSPTPQPVAQGGANLTRKYSDRKPVPPLLPDPAYDPSNAHVSIPPRFITSSFPGNTLSSA